MYVWAVLFFTVLSGLTALFYPAIVQWHFGLDFVPEWAQNVADSNARVFWVGLGGLIVATCL